ncbi:MAG: riboflavin synthase [Candidatus Omnitrophica bacterium]|nr:riboflavin synthase [Candidatus Omnitrophota bacterium]
MFTGIIEQQGSIEEIAKKKNLWTLVVKPRKVWRDIKLGESVAISGVCLTVTKKDKGSLQFDLMKETLAATTLGKAKSGQLVNLERALKAGDRLGGHFITGHVDAVAIIKNKVTRSNYVEFQIQVKNSLRRYFVEKGSVAVDGVSLTIGKVAGTVFSIYLIPYTLQETTLGLKKSGDLVNIETDILAKYVLR